MATTQLTLLNYSTAQPLRKVICDINWATYFSHIIRQTHIPNIRSPLPPGHGMFSAAFARKHGILAINIPTDCVLPREHFQELQKV